MTVQNSVCLSKSDKTTPSVPNLKQVVFLKNGIFTVVGFFLKKCEDVRKERGR